MVDVVRAVVAQKTGKLLLEIPKTKSIKELVAGKSTVQNEIAAGLQKELGKPIPDNGEDIPLHVLAKKLGAY
ncbi:beta subunit of fatty acid synthetase, partial [Linderina pennispora]